MFFMGILMSVEALNAEGLLGQLAQALNEAVPNVDIIAASIGLVSALIDNVPLVGPLLVFMCFMRLRCSGNMW